MSTWKINLENKTATSINGITFKLTERNWGIWGRVLESQGHTAWWLGWWDTGQDD